MADWPPYKSVLYPRNSEVKYGAPGILQKTFLTSMLRMIDSKRAASANKIVGDINYVR